MSYPHSAPLSSPTQSVSIFAPLVNDELVSVPMCTPVYSDAPGGFKKALGDGSAKGVLAGVVIDQLIAAGARGAVLRVGVITATTGQWDVVCGTSGGLTYGTLYYLSTTVAGALVTSSASGVPVIFGLGPTIGAIVTGSSGGSTLPIATVAANPNNSLTASRGSLAIDTTNTKLYQNADGSMAWNFISAGGATPTSILSCSTIATWGDSLTAGLGSVSPLGGYPSDLAISTGYTVTNGGVVSETSTQIRTRMIAAPGDYGFPTIIWAGRNNFAAGATVQADIAAMVAALTTKNYLVLSVVNTDTASEYSGGSDYVKIIALNAALAATYGAHYFDIRSYLVSQYNPGIPQDVIDHGHDIPPSSLRSDSTHYNDAGYALVAAQVLPLIESMQQGVHVLTEADFRFVMSGAIWQNTFAFAGTATVTPKIVFGGATPTLDNQICLKNTRSGGTTGGVQVAVDTTVNAGARAGYTFVRGAGGGYGSGNSAGLFLSGGSDIIVGAAAGDLCVYTELTNKILFSADSSGFTLGAQLDNVGNLDAKTSHGIIGAGRFRSGNVTPNTNVVGSVGDYYTWTGGGAGTTLWVKESGAGTNTGWVGK